jgi:hypothetical protein
MAYTVDTPLVRSQANRWEVIGYNHDFRLRRITINVEEQYEHDGTIEVLTPIPVVVAGAGYTAAMSAVPSGDMTAEQEMLTRCYTAARATNGGPIPDDATEV